MSLKGESKLICNIRLSINTALFWSVLCFAGIGLAAPESPSPVSFGFFIDNGTLIIEHIKPSQPNPTYSYAICEQNQVHPIRFLQIQFDSPQNTRRHTAKNFENLPGSVYSTTNSRAHSDESCMLAPVPFITSSDTLPRLTRPLEPLAPELVEKIEVTKNRKVSGTWVLADSNSNVRVSLVLFEQINDDALASLVLISSDKLLFRDYPAKANRYSTWRVDDGGVIIPRQFKVLFLRRQNLDWEMATEFAGAEGSSLEFLVEKDGQFKSIYSAYRYTSPF